MCKVSVITINLNNAHGLRRTIESVVAQTFTDYEYIVIDGGSTDSSVEVIKDFSGKINYWISEPDKGVYNAMNKGIMKSVGEYLQFLNSGDFLADKKVLEEVFKFRREAGILYGDIYFFSDSHEKKLHSFNNVELDSLYFFKRSLAHCSTFIRRDLIINEPYDENLKIVSDWKFFYKKIVLESNELEYIHYPIACFKEDGISSLQANQVAIEKERAGVLREYLPEMMINDYGKFNKIISTYGVNLILQLGHYPLVYKFFVRLMIFMLKILSLRK
jgi:glycosyltransferase involved in cell wall biosynthesis